MARAVDLRQGIEGVGIPSDALSIRRIPDHQAGTIRITGRGVNFQYFTGDDIGMVDLSGSDPYAFTPYYRFHTNVKFKGAHTLLKGAQGIARVSLGGAVDQRTSEAINRVHTEIFTRDFPDGYAVEGGIPFEAVDPTEGQAAFKVIFHGAMNAINRYVNREV